MQAAKLCPQDLRNSLPAVSLKVHAQHNAQ